MKIRNNKHYLVVRSRAHVSNRNITINRSITSARVVRPIGLGHSVCNHVIPLLLLYFHLCPPSGDGRVFKTCHRPGWAEFSLIGCVDCVS